MTTLAWEVRVELAQRFAPYLVLFPEKQELGRPNQVLQFDGQHRDVGDYHPRSLELLLEHGRLYSGTLRTLARGQLTQLWDQSQRPLATLDNLAKSAHAFDQIRLLGPAIPNPVRAWERYFYLLADTDHDGQRGYDRFPLTTYVRVVTREEARQAHMPDGQPQPERYKTKIGRPFYQPDDAQDDDLALQYWYCYYFNDWANIHEADWEGVTLFLHKAGANWRPRGATFSTHENGARRHWQDMEVIDNTHPVVYIAAGSHASYFQYVPDGHETQLSGYILAHFRLKVGFNVNTGNRDFVTPHDATRLHTTRVEVLPDPVGPTNKDEPAWQHKHWLSYQGTWGACELGRIIAGGPTGPSHQGLKWPNPFAWSETDCWPDYLVY